MKINKNSRRGLGPGFHRLSPSDAESIGHFHIPPYRELSIKEEREFFEKIRNGDKVARDVFMGNNMTLVVAIAKRYCNQGLELEDLVNCGVLGLIKAIEGFDPSMGFRFSTYAVWSVRQQIQEGIASGGRTIRLPKELFGFICKLRNLTTRLTHELGRVPTPREVADRAGIKPAKLKSVLKAMATTSSFDTPIPVGDDRASRVTFMRDEQSLSPEGHLETSEQIEHLRGKIAHMLGLLDLSCFRAEDREVFLAYNLNPGRTLESIAQKIGLTRECIRRRCKRVWYTLSVLNTFLAQKRGRTIEKEDRPITTRDDLARVFDWIEELQKAVDGEMNFQEIKPKTFSPKEQDELVVFFMSCRQANRYL